jgi:hypothetical protein
VADGQAVTLCAPSRNSAFYQDFLQLAEQASPEGTIYVITGNLQPRQQEHPGLAGRPSPHPPCFHPQGRLLNMQEAWWRIFRRQALAGQSFAGPDEIARATQVATAQLNARAKPWIWGRPEPKHRTYRRRFIYTL